MSVDVKLTFLPCYEACKYCCPVMHLAVGSGWSEMFCLLRSFNLLYKAILGGAFANGTFPERT